MAETKTFSRGDLTAFRGVDHDALQYWFREGLLEPEPAEPRKHRRFSKGEAKIAALLGEARSQGLNIAALRFVAERIREATRFREQLLDRLGGDVEPDAELAAIKGEEDAFRWWVAWNVAECTGNLSLRCDEEGEWHINTLRDIAEGKFRSEVSFNLGLILEGFKE